MQIPHYKTLNRKTLEALVVEMAEDRTDAEIAAQSGIPIGIVSSILGSERRTFYGWNTKTGAYLDAPSEKGLYRKVMMAGWTDWVMTRNARPPKDVAALMRKNSPSVMKHVVRVTEPSRAISAGCARVVGVSLPSPPWGCSFERHGDRP